MKTHLLLIAYFVLQVHALSAAREKPFFHYTEESGLAYNAVYCASRDDVGNLWVGTGNGLSIYDGNKFTNIRKTEGLPGNMVWAVEPAGDDLAYVACYLGGVAVFHKKQIIKTLHLKHPVKDDTFRKLLYSPAHKTLFAGTDFGIYVLKDTTFHLLGHFNEPLKKSSVLAMTEYQGKIYFTIHNDRETGGFFRLDIHPEDILKSKAVQISGDGQGYGLTISNGHIFAALENVIYRYDPESGKTEKHVETDRQFYSWTMSGKKNGEIFVGGFGEGPYKTGIFSLETSGRKIMPVPFNTGNVSVMNLIYDQKLHLTYACTDHGLYLFPDSPFEIFPLPEGSLILDILALNNTIYILTDHQIYKHTKGRTEPFIAVADIGKIMSAKAGEYLKHSEKNYGQNNVDRLMSQLEQSQNMVPLYFTSDRGSHFLQTSSGAISFPDLSVYLPIPHGLFTTKGVLDTILWVPRYDLLKVFPSIRNSVDNPYFRTRDSIQVKDIAAIISRDQITYLASYINGLYAIEGNRIHHLNSSNSEMDDVLFGMALDAEGKVWCASSEGNLFRVSLTDSLRIQRKYDRYNSTIQGVSYKWLLFHEKYLYLGTDEGLNQIPINELKNDTIRRGYFYNRHNGYEFISAKSPQLTDDGSLYVYASDKFIRILPDEPSPAELKIIFSDTKLNNRMVDLDELTGRRLPSRIRSISVNFSAAKIPGAGNIEYSYRINDNDDESGNAILLSNPRSGEYQLLCEALDKETSKKYREVIRFSVKEPLWQKPWVIGLFVLSTSGLIYFLTKLRYSRKRKKEAEKILLSQKIADLQIQSLQSQINPHFVFNSLNSIQNFILNNNPEEASFYLATLGGIIRNNLEMISEEFITLTRETEFLKKYIEIEKLRYKDKLKIEMINQVSNGEMILIPPMLIQPLVENSIKHGIRILNKEGIIRIKCELQNGILTVCVEDNGIGRANALQHKDQNHNSHGLKLIAERLALLADKYKTDKFRMNITDLHMEEKPAGTRVEIMIPQIF